ncbi:hypothetical protein AWZ03_009161 [Drosophila navojoa]|uniref:Myb/SANT-like DNA-binding domain-containing protein n=1 Tax=Drosophila navojoa TaxID=7232 RepID=A0A484B802_DRONA|nr:uncharacterized protein LOC108650291 [Drosophila navojoa]TDG44412.1 hypothetical protein AWZ03_009161 [Drosophila navojoa]
MTRKWSKKETKLLLHLYLKYKREFRERHKKRAEIWQHVVREFEQHGFKASYIMLDRKFRNMSRTYFNIKRLRKDDDPSWEYFDAMDEIFSGTLPETRNITITYKEPPEEEESQQVFEIKTEEPEVSPSEILLDEPNFEELVSSRIKEEQPDIDMESTRIVQALEAERVEELRAIRITLEEANEIQRQRNTLLQERNELMRRYLGNKVKRTNPHLFNLIN